MVSVSEMRPPAGVEVQRCVLDTLTDLRAMRASMRQAITSQSVSADAGSDELTNIVLVASELAANGLAHGRPPAIVRLLRTDDRLILDVEDHEPSILPEYADGRSPGAGGMGLHLARRLALHVGWYVSGQTKHVWAQFPLLGARAQ